MTSDPSGQSIFLADDDQSVLQVVANALTLQGYRIDCFTRGEDVLQQFETRVPDLVILDILMPDMNGLELARQIREISTVPIFMLTAMGDISWKVLALETTADDYLTKPLDCKELAARVKAILRRTGTPKSQIIYRHGDLVVDLVENSAFLGSEQINFTPREWAMLRILIRNAGNPISSRQLLQEAWGPEYGDEDDYVRGYISRLRSKLESNTARPTYILLKRGFGYLVPAAG